MQLARVADQQKARGIGRRLCSERFEGDFGADAGGVAERDADAVHRLKVCDAAREAGLEQAHVGFFPQLVHPLFLEPVAVINRDILFDLGTDFFQRLDVRRVLGFHQ